MTETMNKNTVPKVERPSFLSRLIGRYAMFRYMPALPEDEPQDVDLEELEADIEACALANMPQVVADLESDGITGVEDEEVLRISKCLVLDDLRTLANE